MFIISITVHSTITEQQQSEMFPQHAAWFAKYAEQGVFILLGPYCDTDEHAGVIITKNMPRAELDAILAEDVYYPDFADYSIREFEGKFSQQS